MHGVVWCAVVRISYGDSGGTDDGCYSGRILVVVAAVVVVESHDGSHCG